MGAVAGQLMIQFTTGLWFAAAYANCAGER
jgi:hypothetical protein